MTFDEIYYPPGPAKQDRVDTFPDARTRAAACRGAGRDVCRYITHDDDSSVYWSSRKLAERHARAVGVGLYREISPWGFGPGVIVG